MKLQTGSKQLNLLVSIKIKVMSICIFGELIAGDSFVLCSRMHKDRLCVGEVKKIDIFKLWIWRQRILESKGNQSICPKENEDCSLKTMIRSRNLRPGHVIQVYGEI